MPRGCWTCVLRADTGAWCLANFSLESFWELDETHVPYGDLLGTAGVLGLL